MYEPLISSARMSVEPEKNSKIEACIVCINDVGVDGAACALRGSGKLLEMLKQRLAQSSVSVESYMCFGGCEIGPNIVLYPEGTWYSEVQEGDIEEIAKHLLGGPKVERLSGKVDPALEEMMVQIIGSIRGM